MDLQFMLNYVAARNSELSQHYGSIPARSVGAFLRSLVIFKSSKGLPVALEPSLEDLMRQDLATAVGLSTSSMRTLFM